MTTIHPEGSIDLEVQEGVLLIGINRPNKRNGFTPKMYRELGEAYTRLDDDPSLRVGVLHAVGDHFTAGLDLPTIAPLMQRGEKAVPLGLVDPLNLGMEGYRRRTKPMVVAVQGITYTLGIELMLAADILASRSAFKEASDLLEKIRSTAGTALTGNDELKWYKLSAKVALGTGDGAKAMEMLEGVIQKNPLDAEALIMAGDYYARNGQPEKALFRYETAGKIDGFEADSLVKQAQLMVSTRKYEPALELLRKAQKVKPRDNVQRYLERVEQVARNASRRS